jgi:hypothetical protein
MGTGACDITFIIPGQTLQSAGDADRASQAAAEGLVFAFPWQPTLGAFI